MSRGRAHCSIRPWFMTGHAVAHRERLLLVVGDVDERDAHLLVEGRAAPLERLAELGVERAERFVEQQHPGLEDQARASATRCCWPPDSSCGLRFGDGSSCTSSSTLPPGPARRLVALANRNPKATLSHTDMWGNRRVALEDGVDRTLLGRHVRDVLAVDADRPFGRPLEPADHPQRRRLAAARRPEQRVELARRDLDVDAVDGHGVAEALDEARRARCVRRPGRVGRSRSAGLPGHAGATVLPDWPVRKG